MKNQDQSVTQNRDDINTGEIPLTSDQSWYLNAIESIGRHQPERFNINVLFETDVSFIPQYMEKTIKILLEYHDELRARFIKKDSLWRQIIVPLDNEPSFYYFDFSALPEMEQKEVIEKTANDLQSKFNLQKGPLFLVALFHLGIDKPDRLFLTCHHLLADYLSLEILFWDFQKIYQSLANGQVIKLLPKTASLRQYAIRLNEYAKSPAIKKEIDFWLNLPWDKVPHLPLDFPDNKENNLVGSIEEIIVSLTLDDTNTLLQNVKTYQAQLIDVLLWALIAVITDWTKKSWAEITVMNSGRNIIPGKPVLNLSHTVGWIAMSGVLVLEKIDVHTAEETIRKFEASLSAIPNRGLGFSLLAYLHGDKQLAEKLLSYRKDEVLFNFIGNSENKQSLLRVAQESPGKQSNPKERRFNLIYCVASVTNSQLMIIWTYSSNLHKRTTIESLANRYLEVLKERFL